MNSMSDLFHAKVPLDYIRDVFDVIAPDPQHTYQVLTKRLEATCPSGQTSWTGHTTYGSA